jgi:putative heme-binding domain-containing protein
MQELLVLIDEDTTKQKARLEQMLAALGEGDAKRGQLVFNGTKAACSTCHAVGYLGGDVGPDLTRIARIRNDRDLLESILFPNASFTQGYESVIVMTKAGIPHTGRVRKSAPDEVVLAINATQDVRLQRAEIAQMAPSRVSVMPAGLDQQLTPQELADLLAFLKACK